MIQSVNDPPLSNPENLQEKGIASRDASLAEDEKKYAATLAYRQDAFGDESNAEVKYKVMKWWQCGLLMVAETVSLGVLSLPAAVAGLGLVPSVILLVSLGIIATYTGYVLGQFKLQYPWVHNMGLAGEVVFGSWGREILGAAQMLLLVFIMASHILTFVIAMNTLTDHGTCSIVFGVAGLIVSFILSLPRTLAKMSWLSLVSFISIISAVIICMIGVIIKHPGGKVMATVDTDLVHGFSAVTNIVFAFSGHAAYFGLMAELKDPRDFPKALMLLQSVDVCLYIIAAIVIYVYGGDEIASPALGSADPLISKVAYGIALPTIIIAGVINGHVAIKYVYLRIFANKKRADPQKGLGGRELLGRHRALPLDRRLDHRRSHSSLQQPVELDHCPLRFLVHVRAQRYFLALPQPGPVLVLPAQDVSDDRQSLLPGLWRRALWSGLVRLRKGDP